MTEGRNAERVKALAEDVGRAIYGQLAEFTEIAGFPHGYAWSVEGQEGDYGSGIVAATTAPLEDSEAEYFRLDGDVTVWKEEQENGNGDTGEDAAAAEEEVVTIPDDVYVYWFDGLWFYKFVLVVPSCIPAFATMHSETVDDVRRGADGVVRDGVMLAGGMTSSPNVPSGGLPQSEREALGPERAALFDLKRQ
ncbi:MAG: hypothetical protein ACR2JY_23470 [Chloroflexota bacterium]